MTSALKLLRRRGYRRVRSARGHRARAAAALGVPLRTLAHRIQVLGIGKDDLEESKGGSER